MVDDEVFLRWHSLYKEAGLVGFACLGYVGSDCGLSEAQQTCLKALITGTLPRSPREVGVFILTKLAIDRQSRSGPIKLL
jgi:hypothetical protein